jgi:hypothetical protein
MIRFLLGLSALAFVVGFLVGASASPVAGIAISALFGIVATAVTMYRRTVVQHNGSSAPSQTQSGRTIATPSVVGPLGTIFLAFAVALASGIGLGIYLRVVKPAHTYQKHFVWRGRQAPPNIRAALDWAVVGDRLAQMGYSQKDIVGLYELYLNSVLAQDASQGKPPLSADPLWKSLPPGRGHYEIDQRFTNPLVSHANDDPLRHMM